MAYINNKKVLSIVRLATNEDLPVKVVNELPSLGDSEYSGGDRVLLTTDNYIYELCLINVDRPMDGYQWRKLIAPSLQAKMIPLALEERTIIPEENYDGFSEVTVQGLDGYVEIKDAAGNELTVDNLGIENNIVKISTKESVESTEDTLGEFLNARIDNNGNKILDYLFYYVKGLKETNSIIKLIDFSDKVSANSMFSESGLVSVEGIDFGNVSTIYRVFYNCSSLVNISSLKTSNVTNFSEMCYGCSKLTKVPALDTSNGTDFNNMFKGCYALTEVSALDTSNGTDFRLMFSDCRALIEVPALDTSNGTKFNNMFYDCRTLTTIPALDTSKGTNLNLMFAECYNLQTVDITSMDKVTTSYSQVCRNCYSLTKFIIRTMTKVPQISANAFDKCYHILGTTDSTYNPNGLADGFIYVPDAYVEQLKVATNWSVWADQIKPLSELEE